jgi:hypothetical protein
VNALYEPLWKYEPRQCLAFPTKASGGPVPNPNRRGLPMKLSDQRPPSGRSRATLGFIRAVAVAAVTTTVTLGIAFPVVADDHAPPVLRVLTSDDRGTAALRRSRWLGSENGFCYMDLRTHPWNFGNGIAYSAGGPVTLRFTTSQPPLRISVRVWKRVNAVGRPVGEPTRPQVRISPHFAQGELAWDGVSMPPDRHRLYLGVRAAWRDADGCGGLLDVTNQVADWTFALRRIRLSDSVTSHSR